MSDKQVPLRAQAEKDSGDVREGARGVEIHEENRILRAELDKRTEQFKKERMALMEKLKKTDEKFNQAQIKRQKSEYELSNRKKDFEILMKNQMDKIEKIKAGMLEGIQSVAGGMAAKELQWASKFRASQAEVSAMVKKNMEEDMKKQAAAVERALDDIDSALADKVRNIKKKLDELAPEEAGAKDVKR